jgi:hypothetical protein
MKHEEKQKGDNVFKYGDVPDKFYIILQGKVGIHVPMVLNTNQDVDNKSGVMNNGDEE